MFGIALGKRGEKIWKKYGNQFTTFVYLIVVNLLTDKKKITATESRLTHFN